MPSSIIGRSTWKGLDPKAGVRLERPARALCDGLDKIFRTVSQGVWALGLCWVGEGHNSLERGCSYAQQEHIEGKWLVSAV